MNKKLSALADEMIKEVRNLKDLTKKELPEIAKEYVNFGSVVSLVLAIGFSVLSLICISVIIYGINYENLAYEETKEICIMLGSLFLLAFGFATLANFHTYLEYKYMPRRKAIEAITSLLKD